MKENIKVSEELKKLSLKKDNTIEQIYTLKGKIPREPIFPKKPILIKNTKPYFFEIYLFIYYFFSTAPVAVLIACLFFKTIGLEFILISSSLVPLIFLTILYVKERKIYLEKKSVNNQKEKDYNKTYKEYLLLKKQYNNELKIFNENYSIIDLKDKIKHLEQKDKEITSDIKYIMNDSSLRKELSLKENLKFSSYRENYDSVIKRYGSNPYVDLNEIEKKMKQKERIELATKYLKNIGSEKLFSFILNLLKDVEQVQKSIMSDDEKITQIKKILWSKHSSSTKLWIGGTLGTILGLLIFGTGGIGIAGLGGAIGIWGFLTGTTGGILISSLIQNFEQKK